MWRKDQRELHTCCTNLKNIGTALETYSTDHAGRYPGNGKWQTENISLTKLDRYLTKVPTCPTGAPYVLTTGA